MEWNADRVIAALSGTATVVVGIGVAMWQRNSKVLGYETLSSTSLVTVNQSTRHRLKVTFDGRDVVAPHLMIIRVSNAGGQPVEKTGFESPITVSIESNIIEARVIDSVPADLSPQLLVADKTITIAPLLMNRGESFRIGLLTEASPGKSTWKARIVGGTFRELASGPPAVFMVFLIVILVALLALMLLLAVSAMWQQGLLGTLKGMGVVALVIGALAAFSFIGDRQLWPDRWR